MLEDIVTCTNKYIEVKQINYKRQRNAKSTSEKEIKEIVLLYFAGVFKSGRQNIYDLWNTDGTGVDIFHATMSLARFKFLLQCIRSRCMFWLTVNHFIRLVPKYMQELASMHQDYLYQRKWF